MNLRDLNLAPMELGPYLIKAYCTCGHLAKEHEVELATSALRWPSINECLISIPLCDCKDFRPRDSAAPDEEKRWVAQTAADELAALIQPRPKGEGRAIYPLVIADLEARDKFGTEKYGETLTAFNGRDPLVDAYQEAIDLVVYLRQAIEEKYGEDQRED